MIEHISYPPITYSSAFYIGRVLFPRCHLYLFSESFLQSYAYLRKAFTAHLLNDPFSDCSSTGVIHTESSIWLSPSHIRCERSSVLLLLSQVLLFIDRSALLHVLQSVIAFFPSPYLYDVLNVINEDLAITDMSSIRVCPLALAME